MNGEYYKHMDILAVFITIIQVPLVGCCGGTWLENVVDYRVKAKSYTLCDYTGRLDGNLKTPDDIRSDTQHLMQVSAT